jgi:polygalacturonase
MISDRRNFLIASAAAWAMLPGCGVGQTTGRILSPEEFGAKGDGRSNDTVALQLCLDRAGSGDVVRLRKGAVYLVDTNWQPTLYQFGGLKLRSNRTLELNGAELRALPSREVQGAVLQGFRTSGWKVRGPGKITGERHSHVGTAGEWGMGIASFSSTDWEVSGGIEIAHCWGDGIYVGLNGSSSFSQRFLIDSVNIWDCRRNGISVVGGRDGRIRNVDIRDINGVAPQGGIDLEPDDVRLPNRNIAISGGRIGGDLQVGIYVTVANERISISDMDIEAPNSGVLVSSVLSGVTISHCRIHSRVGGAEGAAIRTVGDAAKIAGLHITDNVLTGGGYFVVDIFGEGYRDIVVNNNKIQATNKGTQGIARVHHGSFRGNDCLIGRLAGKAGDYFVHFIDTDRGGNTYRNLSAYQMYSAIRGGRDYGGDTYPGPRLIYRYEPG